MEHIIAFYEQFPNTAPMASLLAFLSWVVAVVILALIVHFIAKFMLIRVGHAVTKKTETIYDDILADNNVFARLAHIAPAIVILILAPAAQDEQVAWLQFIETLSYLYITVSVVLFFNACLSAISDIYDTTRFAKRASITSFIQVGRLIVFVFAIIIGISLIIGKSPATLIAGLGAMTAVLMLVFKDPIMGFVAGIQLSSNRMVNRGDWIEMPQYGVDGDVIEIGLTTVKIMNFDKTITTVPTQTLITDSFKNWRGIQEAGGRRIKRSVMIDLQTITFCDADMIARLSKIHLLTDYLTQKTEELSQHNQKLKIDPSALANGRRLTNIGVFRAYIVAYLRAHPKVHQELTLLVRQLKSNEHGVPMELYCFTNDIAWKNYENIQADIFDHIFAAAQEFELKLYQEPSGNDFSSINFR